MSAAEAPKPRHARYGLLGVVLVAGFLVAFGLWLHRRATSQPPRSFETGGRKAFHSFLKAVDSGVSAADALTMASPPPTITPAEARPTECAAQYRWNFTESGSEYGTVCLDATGRMISTGGGMRFDLQHH